MTPPRASASPRRPAPAPERPRHLELVRGRSVPGRRPPLLFVVAAVVVTGTALFALVTANVVLGQAGFEEAELAERVAEKRLRVELLELDVARLRSPSRIAERAAELGLVPAREVEVLTFDDDAVGGPPRVREGR